MPVSDMLKRTRSLEAGTGVGIFKGRGEGGSSSRGWGRSERWARERDSGAHGRRQARARAQPATISAVSFSTPFKFSNSV